MRNIVFGAVLSVVLTTPAFAGSVTIPNTFTAGTPASAEQVNANFSAVATAVNGNAQNITTLQSSLQTIQTTPVGAVLISVGGIQVGSLLKIEENNNDGGGDLCTLGPIVISGSTGIGGCNLMVVIDQKGFLVGISMGGNNAGGGAQIQTEGSIDTAYFFYDGPNCTGNRYLAFGNQWPARQGYVVASADPTDPNQSYYVQGAPAAATMVSTQSPIIGSNGTETTPACQNGFPSSFPGPSSLALSFYPAIPNNPTITGIPSTLSGNLTVSVH